MKLLYTTLYINKFWSTVETGEILPEKQMIQFQAETSYEKETRDITLLADSYNKKIRYFFYKR